MTGFLLFLTVPTISWRIIPIAIVGIIATFAAIQEGYYIGTRSENSPIFNPFLFITRYLPANIKHALRYESRGMETDVTKIHDFMTRSYSNCGKMNCAPKVGHKVKFNGKSELFSKNSSSTDARVREKYQVNLS